LETSYMITLILNVWKLLFTSSSPCTFLLKMADKWRMEKHRPIYSGHAPRTSTKARSGLHSSRLWRTLHLDQHGPGPWPLSVYLTLQMKHALTWIKMN
jgi:hypothetical protein